MKLLWESALALLFPPLCLHCQKDTCSSLLFCKECIDTFSLHEIEERCPACFSPLAKPPCSLCSTQAPSFERLLAAFSYEGAPATLIQQLKYNNRPQLAKDAAAYMVIQWCRFDLPFPDLIVPVPQSFNRWLQRGYNQSLLIANEMGKWMQRPVADVLKRKSGDLPQMGQSKEQRRALSRDSFSWKERREIADLHVLLVDDVMTTMTTLSHCSALLQQGFPRRIDGLVFCNAD